LDELYDFNKAGRETRDIAFVASRIIHSFIFTPCVSECGGLDVIFFTSDLDKDKRLYLMGIDDVISVFERVGNDDPNRLEWQRHPDGSETTKVS
jgi:hypothetical protein